MKKLLFALIVISGCSPTVSTINTITKCQAPNKPEYVLFDNGTHIGSSSNTTILMNNLNIMKLYSDQLNNTLECYEKQIPKKDK